MTGRALRSSLPFLLIAVLGFALREAFVLRSGGPRASYGYDTSVYYASADALIHGRIPYRDFVLLHPPAIMLALTPAALLGHLTTDHYGFVAASVAFAGLGGVNSALVGVTALRWGLPRRAAIAGALFYATWFGAVSAEFSCRLEPLGNFFLLGGLAAVGQARSPLGRRVLVLGGASLAMAVSTKIWFVVPVVAVAVWLVVRARRRDLAPLALGFGVTALLVNGPFLVLSHGAMFPRVVLDQLGRHPNQGSPEHRWSQLLSVGQVVHGKSGAWYLLLAVLTAVLAAVVVLSLRDRATRLFGVLAVVHIAVLLASPSWFSFYSDYATVPLALTVAAAVGVLGARRYASHAAWVPLAAAATVSIVILAGGSFSAAAPWQRSRALIELVRDERCVMSDSPSGLIELNKLDSGLANGCPNWVDVTGRTYFGRDRGSTSRPHNAVWQRDLLAYLRSGGAAFVVRSRGDGLSRKGKATLVRDGVLARVGTDTLYDTDVRIRPDDDRPKA